MRFWLVTASVLIGATAAAGPAKKQQAGAPDPRVAREQGAGEQRVRGDAWALAGRCDEAIRAYRKSLAIEPQGGSAHVVEIRLAHCLVQTHAPGDEARALLTRAATAAPPVGAQALVELGQLALQAHDFAGAVATFDRLLAAAPEDIDGRAGLLEALAALGAGGDAAAQARGLALAAELAHDEHADAALQRRAEEVAAQLRYGDAARDLADGKRLLAAGDVKGAMAALERAVAKHADLEEAHYLLGVAYASPEVGKKADARRAWKRAPHVKEALLALGVDAYESGDLDQARTRLEAALALDAACQQAWYQLGLVAKELGDTAGARKAWLRAEAIDRSSELGRWASTKLQILTGDISALSRGQVIDASSEVGIGQEVAKQILNHWGVLHDPPLEERLGKLLHRLAQVSDRPERELRYRVVLVDVPMINALTLPGGTILVFKGLVDLVKQMGNSDDAWASVLGHECAHAALRHGVAMIQVASSMVARGMQPRGGSFGDEHDLGELLMTVSREHEFEADQFGALYAYRAGLDPAWSLTLHEKMLQSMGEIPSGMTHPRHAERIARLRDYLLDLRAKVHGFELALKAMADGDYDAAVGRFEVFLGVFPDSLSARSNLGVALHRKALMSLAPATRYRRVTDVDPNARARKIELRANEPQAAGLKSQRQIDVQLLREAAVEYRAALSVDPTYVPALVNLGAVLDDLHDRAGARTVLERAVGAGPTVKEAWNNLGAFAAETGDLKRSLEALQKATALDKAYGEAWFNLGLAYEQAGRMKDAAAAWDAYLALDGKSGWSEVARLRRARLK